MTNKIKITKLEALDQFKEIYADFLKENWDDKIAIRTAWNDYTDMLLKDGILTENQYNTWSQPF